MQGDSLQEPLELLRVVLVEVVLEPDLVLELRPGHGERVVDGAPGALGVGVVDERAFDTQLGRERLLLVLRPANSNAPFVIRDRFMEELLLGQTVFVVNGFQAKQVFEFVAEVHGCRLRHSGSCLFSSSSGESQDVGSFHELGQTE